MLLVAVTVTGTAELRDNSGQYSTGMVQFSHTDYYFITGNYAYGRVRADANAPAYKDGRVVGNARITTDIGVSGYSSLGWLSLSGSGTVNADAWVND